MLTWDRARWAFAAGVALLVFTAAVAGVMIVQLQSVNRRVMHAFDTEMALENMQAAMSAAGRSHMLYSLTSDPRYFTESVSRITEANTRMQAILQQTEDIASHKLLYQQIAGLVDRRMAAVRASLEEIRAGKNDAAAFAGYADQIATLGDEINGDVEQMETHEEAFANDRRITSERLFTAIVSVLACAFAFAIGLLYIHYRLLRLELAERLRAEQSALVSQDSLRLLSVRLIRSQDDQSRKFSRELHDSLGQYLSLVKMNLARYLRKAPPDAILTEAMDLLERSIAESRTISYLLHPPMLDDMGFQFAARWYLEGFATRSGIEINSDIPEDSVRLPMSVEVTLFRVLQESLTNIHRHSGSKRADVSLNIAGGEATLVVRDYGKGISDGVLRQFVATGANVGVGLAGMRERVREQGGQLDIQSNGGGTEITVRIPAVAIAPSTEALAG